jgi:PAS domain-containing protein
VATAGDPQTEKALQESETRYRRLLENSPNGILVVAAARLSILMRREQEYSEPRHQENTLVKRLPILYFQSAAKRWKIRCKCVGEGSAAEKLAEEQFLRLDGSAIRIEATGFAFVHNDEKAAQLIFRDVTDARQKEEALHTSEAIRIVAANMPVVLFALDRAGVLALSEGRGLEALGFKPSEAVGQSVFELYRNVPQVLKAVRRALGGESFSVTLELTIATLETWHSPLRDSGGAVRPKPQSLPRTTQPQ